MTFFLCAFPRDKCILHRVAVSDLAFVNIQTYIVVLSAIARCERHQIAVHAATRTTIANLQTYTDATIASAHLLVLILRRKFREYSYSFYVLSDQ